jgi:trk system potassium uptake protein TrkA
MIGVDEIVYPEQDIAIRTASKLMMKNVSDILPLTEEYGIIEVNAPGSFTGKTLAELDLSKRFSSQVLGIRPHDENDSQRDKKTIIAPTATDRVIRGCTLILLGKTVNIEKIVNLD